MHQPPPYGPPAPSRFVKRGAYMLCLHCNFTSMYCRCSERARDTPAQNEQAESSLARRIAERKDWR